MKWLLVFAMWAGTSAMAEVKSKKAILMLKANPENAEALKKEFKADYVGKPLNPERINTIQRDNLFERAGFVATDFKGFDEMEKDLFLRRVKHEPWAAVLARYPKFSADKMAKLKDLSKDDSRF